MKTLITFCISLFFCHSIFSQNVGIGTTAPKTNLHLAENHTVLFGKDTIGGGSKLMWLPDLGAFRVGSVSTFFNPGAWDRDNIGRQSFASGLSSEAKGRYSVAMGEATQAIGNSSTAFGSFTSATGYSSTAMGNVTQAIGENSTAFGSFTRAFGYSSTAMGRRTQAQSVNSTAIGSYNIGGGDPVIWVDNDPILEIGIGQSEGTRNNALTVLKDGRHGILTNEPKANLHVAENGTLGSGTIVAVLESNTSNRPILQFSETPNGDANSGMSIEYDGSGSGSDNKMYINSTNGSPIVDFESNGEVGIGTIAPKANLHVKDDGTSGSGTIVAVLESDISNRPILQFSETANGDANSGMSIEYDGSGSENKMYVNNTNGSPTVTFESAGHVGVGTSSPSEKIHVSNGSILLSNLGETENKGFLLGESGSPTYGLIYDGIGSGADNTLIVREYIGPQSDLLVLDANGKMKVKGLEGTKRRALYAEPDGTIVTDSEILYYSGAKREILDDLYFENIHLPDGARIISILFRYLDDSSNAEFRFRYEKRGIFDVNSVLSTLASTGTSSASASVLSKSLTIPIDAGEVNNQDFTYSFTVSRDEPIFGVGFDLRFFSYRIQYTLE